MTEAPRDKSYLAGYISEAQIEILKPSTVSLAQKTRTPRNAFIAVEIPKVKSSNKGDKIVTTGIALLNVEHQPDQEVILDDLIKNSSGKIICYGNFPSASDESGEKRKKHASYSDKDGLNPWDKMRAVCDTYLGNMQTQTQEVRALRKEVERLNAKLSETKMEAPRPEGGKENVSPITATDAKTVDASSPGKTSASTASAGATQARAGK